MSRIPLPMSVGDVSAFARTLRTRLLESETVPSHVELLNIIAKAGGFRNFQHLKAQHEPVETVEVTETAAQAVTEEDLKRIKRLLRLFDAEGRLIRWPGKFTLRMLCLWAMWSHIPARDTLSEAEINDLLGRWHLFEDHALLRREMADHGMVRRTADGRQYSRIEQQPPAAALELIRQIGGQATIA